MKKILVILTLLSMNYIDAASYSEVSKIKGMTIGVNHVRVQLEVMKPAEQCSVSNYYFLDTSVSKDMYSALLSAKASGQLLSLQLDGCHLNMPKISHVYLCDTHFCS